MRHFEGKKLQVQWFGLLEVKAKNAVLVKGR
jgi:hypothetical protein